MLFKKTVTFNSWADVGLDRAALSAPQADKLENYMFVSYFVAFLLPVGCPKMFCSVLLIIGGGRGANPPYFILL